MKNIEVDFEITEIRIQNNTGKSLNYRISTDDAEGLIIVDISKEEDVCKPSQEPSI